MLKSLPKYIVFPLSLFFALLIVFVNLDTLWFNSKVSASGEILIYTIEDLNNVRNGLSANYILMNDLDFNNPSSWSDYATNYDIIMNGFDSVTDELLGTAGSTTYTVDYPPIANTGDVIVKVDNVVREPFELGVRGGWQITNYTAGQLSFFDINGNPITPATLYGVWSSRYVRMSYPVPETIYLGWFPIAQPTNTHYTGIFDGQGHTISNLFIDRPLTDNMGLFGSYSGEIKNLGVINVDITGRDNVGALAGASASSLFGVVNNCYSTGSVSGRTKVAGLVGVTNVDAIITDSYSLASVDGTGVWPGGLISSLSSGTIVNSYYNYTTVLINGISQYGYGALSDPYFTDWLANGKTFDLTNYGYTLDGEYYQINTLEKFKLLREFSTTPSLKFRLTTNINLIGDSGFFIDFFNAQVDGANFEVSNLSFTTTESQSGLFRRLGPNSVISNLGVVNANLTVGGSAGILVGLNKGLINNCYSSGVVNSTTSNSNHVGGLVGSNYEEGTIINSHSTVTITGSRYLGGLVGTNYGSISGSHTSVSVTGLGDLGGLVGWSGDGGTIDRSYASGTATATSSSSYQNGGLVGGLWCNTSITNSYATVSLSSSSRYTGGLIGNLDCSINTYFPTIENSYYNYSTVLINGNPQYGIGSLADPYFTDWLTNSKTFDLTDYGFVLNEGDYVIDTLERFKQLREFSNTPSLSFRLSSNIDLIGDVGFYIPDFNAQLDGGGYKISNVSINSPSNSNVGLFSLLFSKGSISNFEVENVNIIGQYNVGLIGFNGGSPISNVFVKGSFTGEQHVGGLVGKNLGGNINGSRAEVTIIGTGWWQNYIGGLVGGNESGDISDSHTIVDFDLQAGERIGGLVGVSRYGTISNSSSTFSSVTSDDYIYYVGGLVGISQYGDIINSNSIVNIILDTQYSDLLGGLVGQFTYGEISNSNSIGQILGFTDSSYLGGLAASASNSDITNCYSTVNVSGGDLIGGLIGESDQLNNIKDSFARGNVMGDDQVGGLIGYHRNGTITNSYARGNVTESSVHRDGWGIGGLVGNNIGGVIVKSYATGLVDAGDPSRVGGLIGYNTGVVEDSFWDTQTSLMAVSDGGTGKTTAQMKSITTFNDTSTEGLDEVWDILGISIFNPNSPSIWYIDESNDYPQLFFEHSGWEGAEPGEEPPGEEPPGEEPPDEEPPDQEPAPPAVIESLTKEEKQPKPTSPPEDTQEETEEMDEEDEEVEEVEEPSQEDVYIPPKVTQEDNVDGPKKESIFKNIGTKLIRIGNSIIQTLLRLEQNIPGFIGTGVYIITTISYVTVNFFVATGSEPITTLQLFSSVFLLGSLKKRKNQEYGVVYDSLSKEPLSMVTIRAMNELGKLISTVVTDIYGIFDLRLPNGRYELEVTGKDHLFPSKLIVGTEDNPYQNVYKGGLVYYMSSKPFNISIPMDKYQKGLLKSLLTSGRSVLISILNIFLKMLFLVGFGFTLYSLFKSPTTLVWVIFVFYILSLLVFLYSVYKESKSYGTVSTQDGILIEDLEIGLRELEFDTLYSKRVTDENGKYRFIVPGGRYRIEILNSDYELVESQEREFEVRDGSVYVIKEDVVVREVTGD